MQGYADRDRIISTISSYSYDLNGNLISIKNGNGVIIASYEYDEQNQLTKLTNSQGTTSYTYNPEGLRSSKTQGTNKTGYYYDGDNVIIETINNNFAARNIMGINSIARETNTSKLYYLYNGHADVVAMADAIGNVVNSYSYDIYGNILSANEPSGLNPIRYAGQYYDNESEMYYLRARFYDPELMRFITEDSYKGDMKDPLSLNLYTYCKNNPIKYYDPSGHEEDDIVDEEGDGFSSNNTGASQSNVATGGASQTSSGLKKLIDNLAKAFKDILKQADEVNKSISGKGPVVGTNKHTLFKGKVDSMKNPYISTEVTYLNGDVVKYRTKGGVRLDVVLYNADGTIVVFDLKTGSAMLTESRILQIQKQVCPQNPSSVIVIEIK